MHTSFQTPGRVLVVVENGVGLVAITAREGATTEVTLEADSAGAEDLIEHAVVECRPSGGRETVRVKIPHRHGMKFVRRNAVTVRIETPVGAAVDVRTASADVELNGTLGEVAVKTASGDMNADDIDGSLNAKTASGDLSVVAVSGDLRLQSASGDLRADRVGGRTTILTVSGDMEIGALADRVEVRSTSGAVKLGEINGDANIVGVSGDVRVLSFASGEMRIRAVSADVTIGVAQGVNLEFHAESMSGTVCSEIPLDEQPSGKATDAMIEVRTVSGDVQLERAVAARVA